MQNKLIQAANDLVIYCEKVLEDFNYSIRQSIIDKTSMKIVEGFLPTIKALISENQALLSKNKELEDELETRRAYIVANPCAQCGGKINAMKCGEWKVRAEELEGKIEIAKNDISRALLKSRQHRSENAVDILENALKEFN